MYRSYENPRELEKQLNELNYQMITCTDDEQMYDLYLEMQELKDRINFAWQDEEAG